MLKLAGVRVEYTLTGCQAMQGKSVKVELISAFPDALGALSMTLT